MFIQDYAQGSVDAWLDAVGFAEIRTDDIWLTNQVSRGLKPLPINNNYDRERTKVDTLDNQSIPVSI